MFKLWVEKLIVDWGIKLECIFYVLKFDYFENEFEVLLSYLVLLD